ncbi:MAG TPA: acyl-ACP--UDP-N-acetylglucosamine O-acyltransferase [Gammaproteobacteria bacterium]
MPRIHPLASVDPEAAIADDAEIGPYCVIAGGVTIGPRTVVESHARIGSRFGRVTIGADNLIQAGAVLGGPPQDHSYEGGYTELVIGDGNRIGEYATINLGSVKGGVTRIGDRNLIMAYVHIGHDCQLGDHIVITNATQLAGHVTVESHALLSGLAGATQFVRLGAYSFLVAGSFANKDIPPYTIAEGHWAASRACNRVGLRRAGFDAAERRNIEQAVRLVLDRSLTVEEAAARIEEQCQPSPQIEHLVRFLRTSERGIARGT